MKQRRGSEHEREHNPELQAEVDHMIHTIAEEDQMFFRYVHRHLRSNQALFRTVMWSPEVWAKATGSGDWTGKDKTTKELDNAMQMYYHTVHVCTNMLRYSHIACRSLSGMGGNQNNIGFSFPGFDSEVLDIGDFSVLPAWHLFENSGHLAYKDDTWEGVIGSKSSATELMQTSPDVTLLYEQGKIKEAKEIMYTATLEILHNVCLAAFLRHRKDLKEGDSIGWERDVMSSVSHMQHHEQNWKYLQAWAKVKYWFSPRNDHLNRAINNSVTNFTTLARRQSRSLEIGLVSAHNNRLLFDPLRWIAFVRVAVATRRRSVQKVQLAINRWLEEHPAVKDKKPKNYDDVKKIKGTTYVEIGLLDDLDNRLPSETVLSETITIIDGLRAEKVARYNAMKQGHHGHSASISNSSPQNSFSGALPHTQPLLRESSNSISKANASRSGSGNGESGLRNSPHLGRAHSGKESSPGQVPRPAALRQASAMLERSPPSSPSSQSSQIRTSILASQNPAGVANHALRMNILAAKQGPTAPSMSPKVTTSAPHVNRGSVKTHYGAQHPQYGATTAYGAGSSGHATNSAGSAHNPMGSGYPSYGGHDNAYHGTSHSGGHDGGYHGTSHSGGHDSGYHGTTALASGLNNKTNLAGVTHQSQPDFPPAYEQSVFTAPDSGARPGLAQLDLGDQAEEPPELPTSLPPPLDDLELDLGDSIEDLTRVGGLGGQNQNSAGAKATATATSRTHVALLGTLAEALDDDGASEDVLGFRSPLFERKPAKPSRSRQEKKALHPESFFKTGVDFLADQIICEGFLSKRSMQSQVWKRRWWCLQDGFLYGFQKEREYSTPLEVIDLRTYTSVTPSHAFGQAAFIVASKEGAMIFRADCAKQCNTWRLQMDSQITSCTGVNWQVVRDIAQTFGVALDRDKAEAISPALSTVMAKLGLRTPQQLKTR